jgi:DNA-binding MarR family transcriptional regulator
VNDDQLTLRTAAVIRRGTVRLSRRLRGARSPDALSGAKVGVLGHLHRHGPSSPGAIAAADQLRPQALTRVFAELEADGLIRRAPSAQDGRAATLSLTDTGIETLLRDMAERDRWLAGALDTLSETEVEVLRLAGLLMDRLADLDSPAAQNGSAQ